MKILNVNKYYALRGGADREMFNLEKVLTSHGHDVAPFCIDLPENLPSPYKDYFLQPWKWDERKGFTLSEKVRAFVDIIYNFEAKRKALELIKVFKPDIGHIHNIHYDISPSVIDALRSQGIPVVMHLHDARLLCPNGYLFVNHAYCDRCLYHKYYNAALHKCLKNDFQGSLAAAVANYAHRWMKVWTEKIDRYVVPTEIVKRMAVTSGISESKIDVYGYPAPVDELKPNDTFEPYVLFVGYHVEQKGVFNLLSAMQSVKSGIRLKMCGKGPESQNLQAMIKQRNITNVDFLGYVDDPTLFGLMKDCLFVVLPSIGFENSNALIREANACGKAVLGSRRGGIPELIVDGKTGMIFDGENVNALAESIDRMVVNRSETIAMGRRARTLVEETGTTEMYYKNIMRTYERARKSVLSQH